MRIVYCSDRYWPASGGLETYLRTIAQEMAKEHVVKVITLIRDERSLTETLCSPPVKLNKSLSQDGLVQIVTLELAPILRAAAQALVFEGLTHQLFRQKYYFIRSLWLRYTAHLLSSIIKNELIGSDLIHSMSPWEISHAVNLARGPIPHVITGFLHIGYWADDSNSLRHFRQCDHIVALSSTEQQNYLQFNIPQEKVSVVGVPVREVEMPSKAQLSSPMPLNVGNPLVLFLGVKRKYKGIDLLLDATKYVWDAVPNAQFVFAGPRTPYSQALFADISYDPRIIELDVVPEANKWSLFRKCSLLCLPSETEIMPNVILEAWLMRKTVVTSDIPNLQELVGETGVCVPRNALALSEAIIYLLQQPNITRALGERGWNKCRNEHNAPYIKAKLEDVYHALTRRYSGFLAK